MKTYRGHFTVLVMLTAIAANAEERVLFRSGRGLPAVGAPSRSFEEATRKMQRSVQYFTGDWIESAAPQRLSTPASPEELESLPSLGRLLRRAANEEVPRQPNSAKNVNGGGGGADRTRGPVNRPGAPIALPYWMPFCFLVEPGADEKKANDKIKSISDAYAKCGIVVEPYAFTVKGMPGTQAQATQLSRQSCNFGDVLGVRGAIQVDTVNAGLPKEMCKDQDASGCSTLCEPLSFSVLGPAAGPITGLHESMHSNCCGRLCVNAGEGVEPGGPGIELTAQIDLDEILSPIKHFHADEGANIVAADISKAACESLRQGAAPNDGGHRWAPGRMRFYTHAGEEKQLQVGTSIFQDRQPPPKMQVGDAKDQSGKSTSLVEDGGGRIQYDEAAKVTPGTVAATPKGGGPSSAPKTIRHQQQQQDGMMMVFSGLRQTPDIEAPATNGAALVGGGGSRGGQGIAFNDEAAKGAGGTAVAGGGGGKPMAPAGAGGGGTGARFTNEFFDGSAAVGSATAEVAGTDTKLGYDDEAPKGELGAASPKTAVGKTDAPKPLKMAKAKPRKRGASFKSNRERALTRRTDVIISTRPAPDFLVDPTFINAVDVGYSGGEEEAGSGG